MGKIIVVKEDGSTIGIDIPTGAKITIDMNSFSVNGDEFPLRHDERVIIVTGNDISVSSGGAKIHVTYSKVTNMDSNAGNIRVSDSSVCGISSNSGNVSVTGTVGDIRTNIGNVSIIGYVKGVGTNAGEITS